MHSVFASLLLLVPALAFAQSPLTVFVGGAMTASVREVGAAFEKDTLTHVVYVSDTTGALQKRLAAGEHADVIVVTGAAIDALAKDGRIAAGTRVDLARALIGVAVRAGATRPNISTVDAFKAALLKAASVSYVNPASGGTSGTYFEGLMQRMGIAEAMKPKIVYRTQGSEVADAVAKGQAELGITFTSELSPNPGVTVAGVLPPDIQMPTIYAAALVSDGASAGSNRAKAPTTGAAPGRATAAPGAEAARAFVRLLAGATGRSAVAKAGLEPLGSAR